MAEHEGSGRVPRIRSVIALKGGARWACPKPDGADYWICGHCNYAHLTPYDRECFNCHAAIQWEVVKV